jgi:chromosome segregation ATPase
MADEPRSSEIIFPGEIPGSREPARIDAVEDAAPPAPADDSAEAVDLGRAAPPARPDVASHTLYYPFPEMAKAPDRPTTVSSSGILSHSQVASRQRQRSVFLNEAAEAAKREEDEETLRKLRREFTARSALAGGTVTDDNRSLLVLVHEYRDKYEAQCAEIRTLRAQLEEKDNGFVEEVANLDDKVMNLEEELKDKTDAWTSEKKVLEFETTSARDDLQQHLMKTRKNMQNTWKQLEVAQGELRVAREQRLAAERALEQAKEELQLERELKHQLIMKPHTDADKLAKAEQRVLDLEDEVGHSNKQLRAAEMKVVSMELATADQKVLNETLETKLTASEAKVDELSQQLTQLQSDFQRQAGELEQSKASAVAGIKAGGTALVAAQAKITLLQGEVARLLEIPGREIGPNGGLVEEVACLRKDIQHLNLDVTAAEKSAARAESNAALLEKEVRKWKLEAQQQRTRADNLQQALDKQNLAGEYGTEDLGSTTGSLSAKRIGLKQCNETMTNFIHSEKFRKLKL